MSKIQTDYSGSSFLIPSTDFVTNSKETMDNQYFKCNGYLIDKKAFIRELQMGFSDYIRFKRLSQKDKNEIANYVEELIELIRSGNCYFELNKMIFVNTDYTERKRSKNSLECLKDALFYVSKIAIKMINRGDYVGTY